MWMAEGATNRVYLLGSVHLLRKQDHPLPDVIDSAYDDAETLFMELDMDDLDPIAMQTTLNELGLVGEGESLEGLLGEDLYIEAKRTADELDIPLDMLQQTEPWYAAITVEQIALTRIGFNPEYGVEMYLMQHATRDGKPIYGFETVDEQLEFLDGLSMDAQRELLMQTLADSKDISGMMDELIDAWHHGDVGFMENNLLTDVEKYPELYETIVAERNRRWVDTIDRLLDESDDYLVIVGALHLVGDDGVPRLLEDRGHTVTQMHNEQD